MKIPWFRKKAPEPPLLLDSRKVNLSDVGDTSDKLSMRIERPDQFRPVDPVFAVEPVDGEAATAQTLALVSEAAPVVDEFIADVLNGWLDEHLPGWHARTDAETIRRLDLQRILIAEIAQNYALVSARVGHQRWTVAKLDYVVERAERILAGDTDSSVKQVIPIELPDAASAEPMRLPDPVQVRHPVLDPPSGSPTEHNTTQLFVVRDDEPTRTNDDDRGEVA